MGTRIVVMKDGFMQQVDTPLNLYDHPINQFVAGFIGTPQMNFFTGKLTGTKKAVNIEFGTDKVRLPQEKVDLIVNLDKYLNTDREIVFGIRPEDIHDNPEWIKTHTTMPSIEVKVDVIEALGSETILYCKTKAVELESDTIAADISNLIAKVDSRSTTVANSIIKVGLDMRHCHLFDKETEVTLLARDEANKQEIEALQVKREDEEAKKAAAAAEAAEQALLDEGKKSKKKAK